MRISRHFVFPIMATFLIAGLGIFTPSHSFGAVTFGSGYGVSAGVNTASDCPSFCTGDFDFDSDGGELAAFASATSLVYGISQAQAFYSSDGYLPELKAFSSSTDGRGGSASSFGVQGYEYLGEGPDTITIAFQLDANVMDSGSHGDETTGASLGVIGVDSFEPNGEVVGPFFSTDFGTWYLENIGTQLGTDSVFVNTPNGSDSSSVTFGVQPGDVFFVGATLGASSRTGTADAFNTFTANFANPNVISLLNIANPTAIPEPTGLAFLSVIAVGFAARRRRRNH